MKTLVATGIVFLLSALSLSAQDRQFAWSYGTTTLPAGNIDIEAWNTWSSGREGHSFSLLRQRLEFEFGVTDAIQTSLYLNGKHSYSGPSAGSGSAEATTSSTFSFSNAWKFHLLSPHDNPVGLATYLEYYLSQGEFEMEGKVMLDHVTERHRLVLNTTVEAGFEDEYKLASNELLSSSDVEWKWETTLGYMYMFSREFGLGIEARNLNAIHEGAFEYSALFAGPSIHISPGKYFLIFNFMPQLTNLTGVNSPLELQDQERYTFRALLGISL